jgi:integrase
LTANAVKSAQSRRAAYSLADGRGLSLLVASSGRKSWRFRYRHASKAESLTLGEYPAVGLTAAREMAQEMRARVARGQSPAEDARREKRLKDPWVSVREFAERWMREVVAKVRKDPDAVRRVLDRDVYPRIGKRPVARVTAQEVQEIVFARRDAGRPESAAVIRHTLKRMFEYAQACGVCAANPVDATKLKFVVTHRSRSRTLSHAELRQFMQETATGDHWRMKLALRVILYTLCRKSELRCARWEHVDLKRGIWEIPAELSKTGKPHIVYLSRQAVDCFRHLLAMAALAEVVLPARDALLVPQAASTLNSQMRKVRWGFAAFAPHDLRRTGATILNEQAYNPDWIEKALNHAPRGIRAVYNRAQYAEQRKQMLQEWADWLEGL